MGLPVKPGKGGYSLTGCKPGCLLVPIPQDHAYSLTAMYDVRQAYKFSLQSPTEPGSVPVVALSANESAACPVPCPIHTRGEELIGRNLMMSASKQKVIKLLIFVFFSMLAPLQFPDAIGKFVNFFVVASHESVKYWVDFSVIFDLAIVVTLLIIYGFYAFSNKILDNINIMPSFNIGLCTNDDLQQIYDLASKTFGGRSSRIETIRSLHVHSPKSFWKVTTDSGRIIGYFIIYGLTKLGEKAIHDGHYNGANPNPKHVSRDINKATAVCVGAIVGNGFRGKALTYGAVGTVLTTLSAERIYGKAISETGLRLVRKYRFERIDGSKEYEINFYYIGSYSQIQSIRAATDSKVSRSKGTGYLIR